MSPQSPKALPFDTLTVRAPPMRLTKVISQGRHRLVRQALRAGDLVLLECGER